MNEPGRPEGPHANAPHEDAAAEEPGPPSANSAAGTGRPLRRPVEWIARTAYSTLLRALQPAYAWRLRWRGRAEPLYGERLGERFGFYRVRPGHDWVWVHAVSLGETIAAQALIDALRIKRPGMRLLLTHGTATGRAAGQALLREGDHQTWLPYDTPGATRRFIARFRPVVGVLMETEIWPNLLLAAQAARVPMVLANGRLSERSFRRGVRFRAVLRPAIESVALVLAQTEDDARRMRASGARTVEVVGNLKFDLTPDAAQLAQGRAWQTALRRDVVLAAITREGEEAMLLDAWRARSERWSARDVEGSAVAVAARNSREAGEAVEGAIVEAPRPALLIIVPRHPQRFDEVAGLVDAAGFTLARRSAWREMPPADALEAQVWLGDSMREMPLYYGAAKVALLGGSFAPLGGHNLIEAAACGCPLVMGPSTFNFDEAAVLSLAAGASMRAADVAEAVAMADALLSEPERLAAVSARASAFSLQHRGAAWRTADRIALLIGVLSRLSRDEG